MNVLSPFLGNKHEFRFVSLNLSMLAVAQALISLMHYCIKKSNFDI